MRIIPRTIARQAMTSASHWLRGANQIGAVIPAVTMDASVGKSFIATLYNLDQQQ